MSGEVLARLALDTEADLFAARRVGRECALGLGVETLDAVRLATAISELGRELVATGGGHLTLEVEEPDLLTVSLESTTRPERWASAVDAATRLVDTLLPVEGDLARVVMCLRTPDGPLTANRVEQLRARVAEAVTATAADELREQDRALLTALEELRARGAETEGPDRQLEESSRELAALYDDLSAELERTNLGVVALYAEIDDKNFQLAAASEAKSRFLRSISHELRTPVNSILGLTGLLLDPRQADRLTAEQTEQVEFIRASADDLLRLVAELLDLAKAESGRLEAVMSEVSLQETFAALRGVIEPLLRPGVELELDDGSLSLVTDAVLLGHVLRNLLSNAAKFTTEGTILLRARADGDHVVLEVRDSGVGIPPEHLPRVFEEFYQVPTPLQAQVKGTGLGLPFAQVVAGELGGRIAVESAVGAGSRFWLRLPRGGAQVEGDHA